MSKPPNTDTSTENLQSPLHKLQTDIAGDLPYVVSRESPTPSSLDAQVAMSRNGNFDTDSILSFDSVSTNGRLLDRLDLDADDYTEYEDLIRRRDSTTSLQSSTRRGSDEVGDDWNGVAPTSTWNNSPSQMSLSRSRPIRANSAMGLERARSAKPSGPVRSLSSNSKLSLKPAPASVLSQKSNFSFESLQGEVSSGHGSSVSLASSRDSSASAPMHAPKLQSSKSYLRYNTGSQIPKSLPEPQDSDSIPHSEPKLALPYRQPAPRMLGQFSPGGVRSVSSSSNNSTSSLEYSGVLLNPSSKFDSSVEKLTKAALALRAEGNFRESSYRLQTLANAPYNYPKAMYLYAQALRLGQGVKLNETQCMRWLCRCILTSNFVEQTSPESPAFTSYAAKLALLPPQSLLDMVKNLPSENNDPFVLYEKFHSLSDVAIGKIIQLNSSDKNVVGGAYYLLAESLISGLGTPFRDEETGRTFLAKSASMAYADAMTRLGMLFCGKTKHYKKDYYIASAWLRLGEIFGKQDIGNSWIYKNKYLERKKK